MMRVLLKSIIVPFYRSHAGLLFFVFYVMFGMVESGQLVSYHRALIEGMYNSFLFLVCILIVWALYSFKILIFVLTLLRQSGYLFVNNISMLPQPKAFSLLFLINCAAFLPVLGYSVFIYQVGFLHHEYGSVTAILLFQLALCLINAWVILTYLKTQHVWAWSLPSLRLPVIAGRIGFYVSHFAHDEKIAVVLSKIFSLTLLYLVKENTAVGDDFRITGLAWLFALTSHTFLILKIRAFEDRYLVWTKALPTTIGRLYFISFSFYLILLWPEFLLITTEIGETLTVLEFIMLTLFTGGFMMMIHAHLLKPNRNTDQFSIYLFWLFIASFFVILCKLIIPLTVVLCLSSFLMMAKRWFAYEPVVTE